MKPSSSITRSGGLPVLFGGIFFVAYLGCQAFLAVSCLAVDYGCLLTWTMYSGRGPDPDIPRLLSGLQVGANSRGRKFDGVRRRGTFPSWR